MTPALPLTPSYSPRRPHDAGTPPVPPPISHDAPTPLKEKRSVNHSFDLYARVHSTPAPPSVAELELPKNEIPTFSIAKPPFPASENPPKISAGLRQELGQLKIRSIDAAEKKGYSYIDQLKKYGEIYTSQHTFVKMVPVLKDLSNKFTLALKRDMDSVYNEYVATLMQMQGLPREELSQRALRLLDTFDYMHAKFVKSFDDVLEEYGAKNLIRW